jgi:uncharacterized membrane protein (DUF2068 family)
MGSQDLGLLVQVAGGQREALGDLEWEGWIGSPRIRFAAQRMRRESLGSDTLPLEHAMREDARFGRLRLPRGTLEDRPHPTAQSEHPHNPALATIAIYKFAKATLSVLSAIVAWRFMNPHVEAAMRTWADSLPIGFSEHLVREALAQVGGVPAFRWRQLGLVSLTYAAVFTLEGVGLWRERRWAEYLTIVTSSLLLPFEFIAVLHHVTLIRTGVLLANAVIVAYLIVVTTRHRRMP